jgi:ribosome maturation factor RimP
VEFEKEFESSSSSSNNLHQSESSNVETESSDDCISEQLTAPTTCLDPEELERLEERIAKANQLLLNLALSKGSERETILINSVLEKTFKRMKGVKFTIETNATEGGRKDQKVKGIVNLIGKDFLSIKKRNQEKFIPYYAIRSITHRESFNRKEPKESFLHLERSERQQLVLKFGKTVASSPALFDIFIGRSLHDFLHLQKERFITLLTDQEEITGYIKEITEDEVTITNDSIDKKVPFKKISVFYLL